MIGPDWWIWPNVIFKTPPPILPFFSPVLVPPPIMSCSLTRLFCLPALSFHPLPPTFIPSECFYFFLDLFLYLYIFTTFPFWPLLCCMFISSILAPLVSYIVLPSSLCSSSSPPALLPYFLSLLSPFLFSPRPPLPLSHSPSILSSVSSLYFSFLFHSCPLLPLLVSALSLLPSLLPCLLSSPLLSFPPLISVLLLLFLWYCQSTHIFLSFLLSPVLFKPSLPFSFLPCSPLSPLT